MKYCTSSYTSNVSQRIYDVVLRNVRKMIDETDRPTRAHFVLSLFLAVSCYLSWFNQVWAEVKRKGQLAEESKSAVSCKSKYILYFEFHMLICRTTAIQPSRYWHICFYIYSFQIWL